VEGNCELLVGGGYLSCPCSEWEYDPGFELYLDLPGLPAAEDEKEEETDRRLLNFQLWLTQGHLSFRCCLRGTLLT